MTDPFAPSVHRRVEFRFRPDVERLSVAAVLHKYPPGHGAGAEWMAHSLLRDLLARGHKVDVFLKRSRTLPLVDEVDGVKVQWFQGPEQIRRADPDVVLTHLDMTRDAVNAARHAGAPIVHLLHNHRQLTHHRVRPVDAHLAIANSRWIREKYAQWAGPVAVIHPPVDIADYVTEQRESMVTLMNLSAAKGGHLFWKLAELMPHREFLAVKGAYATQVIPRRIPDNVCLIENTPNVRDKVYARTKILLMPSIYESWGRCAVEAACSGIPTICHPTPGLLESMDAAAVYADCEGPADLWAEKIDLLMDDPEEYARWSGAAYARARELDPKLGDYDRFEELMLAVVRGNISEVAARI